MFTTTDDIHQGDLTLFCTQLIICFISARACMYRGRLDSSFDRVTTVKRYQLRSLNTACLLTTSETMHGTFSSCWVYNIWLPLECKVLSLCLDVASSVHTAVQWSIALRQLHHRWRTATGTKLFSHPRILTDHYLDTDMRIVSRHGDLASYTMKRMKYVSWKMSRRINFVCCIRMRIVWGCPWEYSKHLEYVCLIFVYELTRLSKAAVMRVWQHHFTLSSYCCLASPKPSGYFVTRDGGTSLLHRTDLLILSMNFT